MNIPGYPDLLPSVNFIVQESLDFETDLTSGYYVWIK